jgi:hypothetical protein
MQSDHDALPHLDTNNIEETHLFLNEKGVLVDEKLTRDLNNGILSVHVPAHHDRSELNIVFDENSEWMMMVKPATKSCEIAKKPSVVVNNEKEAFNTAKNDNSSAEIPIMLSSSNKKIKVVETTFISSRGYNFTHEMLPTKFQSYCPLDYTPYTTRIVKEGENLALQDYWSEADKYEFIPGVSTIAHPRSRRQTIPCLDHNGNNIDNCWKVHSITCEEHCPASRMIFKCRPADAGERECFYFTVPCSALDTSGEDPSICIAHMLNVNQKCASCCKQNHTCSTSLPDCSYCPSVDECRKP